MFAFFFITILLLSIALASVEMAMPLEAGESKKIKHILVIIDIIVCCILLILMVLFNSYANASSYEKPFIPCLSISYCTLRALLAFSNKKAHLYISFLLTVVIAMLTIWISIPDTHIHTVVGEYKITIENSMVDIRSDIELPTEAELLIEEEAENMKKFDSSYYQGIIQITYECHTPKYANEHGKTCTCSDKGICNICSKYVTASDVKLSKKIN